MFDVGWSELLVIGALALIVVGPRDLPQLLRQVGKWVGQVKRMAREFQTSLEDAARESNITDLKDLRDLKKEIGNLDFRQQAKKADSYLKQPVKLDAEKPGPGEPAEAKPEAVESKTAAPAEPDGDRPEAAPESAAERATTLPDAGEDRTPAAKVSEG